MRRLSVLALLLAAPAVRAAPDASPELLALVPPETLLLVECNDQDGKGRFGEGTSLGKFLAEPEVQAFAKKLGESLAGAFAANVRGPLGMVGLTPEDFEGIRVRRFGLAVVAVAPEMRQVDVVLYVETRAGGEKVARILKAIRQAAEMFLGVPFAEADVRGRKVISTSALGHEFSLAVQGDRFVFTTRAARMEEVLKAIDEGMPGSLLAAPRTAKLRERMGAQRSALFGYVDAAALLRFLPDDMARRVLSLLGLDAIEAMGFADVPEGAGYRTEGAILLKERRGLLALASKEPPSHRFAKMTPADALLYGAETFDPAAVWDGIVRLAGEWKAGGPGGAPDLAQAEKVASAWLGFDLREGILKALGTEWSGYVAWPGPGGGVVPDAVLFASVRDRAKLEQSLDLLAAKVDEAARASGASIALRKTSFRGAELRFLEITDPRGEPVPVAPAWAFGEDFAVFGLWPQAVKHALMARTGGGVEGFAVDRSLMGRADFQQLLAAAPRNASSATYIDLGRVATFLYASAVPLLQGVQGAIHRPNPHLPAALRMALGGLRFNFEDLPPAEVVARHLTGMLVYGTAEDDCMRLGFVSQFGAPLAIVPVAAMAGAAAAILHNQRTLARVRARAEAAAAEQQAHAGAEKAQRDAAGAEARQMAEAAKAQVAEARQMLAAASQANQELKAACDKLVAENELLRKRLSELEAKLDELLKATEGKK